MLTSRVSPSLFVRGSIFGLLGLLGLFGLAILAACGPSTESGDRSSGSTDLVTDLIAHFPATRWAGERTSPGAMVDPERELLFVPHGERVNYFFRLQPGTALEIDRITRRGSGSSLIVALHRDGGEPKQIARLDPGRNHRIDLPDGDEAVARLSFIAKRTSDETTVLDGEGWALVRPRLVGTELPLYPAPRHRATGSAEQTGSAAASQREDVGEQPNILIYLVDTLRQDRLGIYGYGRPVSPHLDTFAENALIFDNAVAATPWTRASVASILTGLEPNLHATNTRDALLPESLLTAAEILSSADYWTGAVITNGNVSQDFNFDQGFDVFNRSRKLQYNSDQLNERFAKVLNGEDFKEPFFLYVHTIDPHAPYEPPEPFKQRFAPDSKRPELGTLDVLKSFRERRREATEDEIAEINDLYDGDIAFNDDSFGALIGMLEERGLYDNTVVIFVSDHGEEFWEHDNWGHGHSLNGEVMDIPLILRDPFEPRSARIGGIAQHIDILPTLLDYADLEAPSYMAGRSLRHADQWDDEAAWQAPTAYGLIDLDKRVGASIIAGGYKLIVPRQNLGRKPQLYDLADDPDETTNLHKDRPVLAGYLQTLIAAHELDLRVSTEAGDAEMDEELIEELKALGYLN